MIARVSITVAALVALLLAGGTAMAGGMPSDEGPDVVLGEPELEALFTPTITTIIEQELPQYVEVSDIEREALAENEAIAPAANFFELPSAFNCPQYGCGHDL